MSLSMRTAKFARLLQLEVLEDRVQPSVGAAFYDPNKLMIAFQSPENEANSLAAVKASSLTSDVTSIGMGLYRVELASGVTVTDAMEAFSVWSDISLAQPDFIIQADAVPNDPSFSQQWAYRAPSANVGGIGAVGGWSVNTGTRQTIVAVIDSGVDYNHPDLAANMWRNPGEIAGNGRDDDGNGWIDDVHGVNFFNNNGNPMDAFGHGTHVAGVIGAVGNNARGVSGVAWQTQIMALRFMGPDGSGLTSDAVRAIDYAVTNGARIINASWGGGAYNAPLLAAIGRAQQAGAIVVTSAGNAGNNIDVSPSYPAGYSVYTDNMVTVAATDQSDRLVGWSNFGARSVSLAAPGVNILSTLQGGGYGLKSGTSMAAPIVSGALALLWDANPQWNYRQVIDRLLSTVDPLPTLAGRTVSGGRLNLTRLLAGSPPVNPPSVPPPPTTAAGPRVTNAEFSGPRAGVFDRAVITFSHPVNPSSFTPSDVVATGPSGSFPISSVLPIANSNNTRFNLMFSRQQTVNGNYSMTIGPDIRDFNGRMMDQNGNGIGGEQADRFTLTAVLGNGSPPPASPPPPPPSNNTPPAGQTVELNAGNMPRAINDLRTTRVDFDLSQDFVVTNLQVILDVRHARLSDLSIRIVAPNGTTVNLFTRRGGSSANLSVITFDDFAATAVRDGQAPFNGRFRPEQQLSAFNGLQAKGQWSVQVFDLAAGVTGSVNRVTLRFTTSSNLAVPPAQPTEPVSPPAAGMPPTHGATPARTEIVRPDPDATGVAVQTPVRVGTRRMPGVNVAAMLAAQVEPIRVK